eukprot:superscaffoldBa00000363_g4124
MKLELGSCSYYWTKRQTEGQEVNEDDEYSGILIAAEQNIAGVVIQLSCLHKRFAMHPGSALLAPNSRVTES